MDEEMQRDLGFLCDGARSMAPQPASRQKKPKGPTAIPGVPATMQEWPLAPLGAGDRPKAAPTE